MTGKKTPFDWLVCVYQKDNSHHPSTVCLLHGGGGGRGGGGGGLNVGPAWAERDVVPPPATRQDGCGHPWAVQSAPIPPSTDPLPHSPGNRWNRLEIHLSLIWNRLKCIDSSIRSSTGRTLRKLNFELIFYDFKQVLHRAMKGSCNVRPRKILYKYVYFYKNINE